MPVCLLSVTPSTWPTPFESIIEFTHVKVEGWMICYEIMNHVMNSNMLPKTTEQYSNIPVTFKMISLDPHVPWPRNSVHFFISNHSCDGTVVFEYLRLLPDGPFLGSLILQWDFWSKGWVEITFTCGLINSIMHISLAIKDVLWQPLTVMNKIRRLSDNTSNIFIFVLYS